MKFKIHESKRRGRFFRYAPLLFWIGVIFYLSGGQGSFEQTSRFIRPLLEFFFPNASPETLSLYHIYVRKLAHPTVYAVLAVLAARAFVSSSKRLLNLRWPIAAIGLVILIAGLDELNQTFLTSRTGSPWDVVLDTIGGAVALIFCIFYFRRRSSADIGS